MCLGIRVSIGFHLNSAALHEGTLVKHDIPTVREGRGHRIALQSFEPSASPFIRTGTFKVESQHVNN